MELRRRVPLFIVEVFTRASLLTRIYLTNDFIFKYAQDIDTRDQDVQGGGQSPRNVPGGLRACRREYHLDRIDAGSMNALY